jgi:hypothetical protein
MPIGVAADHDGNLYVTDSSRVRKITPGGIVTTLAGSGAFGNVDGTGTAAQFGSIRGITVDAFGNVFVADTFFHTIRKITPLNVVTTFAGLAGSFGTADGNCAIARFHTPVDVAADPSNNIWVVDSDNHTIRRITQDGTVSTVAGAPGQAGDADGLGSSARFFLPQALTTDLDGNAYVFAAGVIRKITPVGLTSSIAGRNSPSGTGANDGPASVVQFRGPQGMAIDASLSFFIADTGGAAAAGHHGVVLVERQRLDGIHVHAVAANYEWVRQRRRLVPCRHRQPGQRHRRQPYAWGQRHAHGAIGRQFSDRDQRVARRGVDGGDAHRASGSG